MIGCKVIKDGATNSAYLRVVEHENFIQHRGGFGLTNSYTHVTTTFVIEIKVKGIIMNRYIPIKTWTAPADNIEDVDFARIEAIEVFDKIVNPYKVFGCG